MPDVDSPASSRSCSEDSCSYLGQEKETVGGRLPWRRPPSPPSSLPGFYSQGQGRVQDVGEGSRQPFLLKLRCALRPGPGSCPWCPGPSESSAATRATWNISGEQAQAGGRRGLPAPIPGPPGGCVLGPCPVQGLAAPQEAAPASQPSRYLEVRAGAFSGWLDCVGSVLRTPRGFPWPLGARCKLGMQR